MYLREHLVRLELNRLLDKWREDTSDNHIYAEIEALEFKWKAIFRKATDEDKRVYKIGRSHEMNDYRMSGRKNSWGKIAHEHRGELLNIIKRRMK